jgi:hypothetical protein
MGTRGVEEHRTCRCPPGTCVSFVLTTSGEVDLTSVFQPRHSPAAIFVSLDFASASGLFRLSDFTYLFIYCTRMAPTRVLVTPHVIYASLRSTSKSLTIYARVLLCKLGANKIRFGAPLTALTASTVLRAIPAAATRIMAVLISLGPSLCSTMLE